MPKNKDNKQGDSKSSMSNRSDREFESQGRNPGTEHGGQQAGTSGRQSGSQSHRDDEDISTSGGRQGTFSDKDPGSQAQWSPGSKQASDQ